MVTYRLRLTEARPFFAEVPHYLWGQINYDSDGNCKSPTDRDWTELVLTNRETDERVEMLGREDIWEIRGEDPLAGRAAHFLVSRCRGEWIDPPPAEFLQNWDHERASARAARVRMEFERPELRPFAVGKLFWGSWKWIGWFATDCTWVGRWIMHSVVYNDSRAVELCIAWLRDGTFAEQQSEALRYALSRLTGRSFITDQEWVDWYDQRGGNQEYPQPDFEKWLADLKAQVVID